MTNLFTIYTYGGGEVVHNIFNAIASIYQEGYMEQLFQISIMLGLAIAGIKAGITQKHGANYAKWLGGLFIRHFNIDATCYNLWQQRNDHILARCGDWKGG